MKTRWKSLREGYVRDMRNSQYGIENKSKYKYSKEMGFLSNTIKFRNHSQRESANKALKQNDSESYIEQSNHNFQETNATESEFDVTEDDINDDTHNEYDSDIFTEKPEQLKTTDPMISDINSSNDELLLVLVSDNDSKPQCNDGLKSYYTNKRNDIKLYDSHNFEHELKKNKKESSKNGTINVDKNTQKQDSDKESLYSGSTLLLHPDVSTSTSVATETTADLISLPREVLPVVAPSQVCIQPPADQHLHHIQHNHIAGHTILRHEDTIFGELVASMLMKVSDENEKKQMKKQILNILL